jgi:hypothetical protein
MLKRINSVKPHSRAYPDSTLIKRRDRHPHNRRCEHLQSALEIFELPVKTEPWVISMLWNKLTDQDQDNCW